MEDVTARILQMSLDWERSNEAADVVRGSGPARIATGEAMVPLLAATLYRILGGPIVVAVPREAGALAADIEAFIHGDAFHLPGGGPGGDWLRPYDEAVGKRLKLRFAPEGGKGRTFRPKVMVAAPGRELRWLGNPGFPGFMESEHYFALEETAGGNTSVAHNMVFYGLLVPLIGSRLESSVLKPFEDMNAALRQRAEKA